MQPSSNPAYKQEPFDGDDLSAGLLSAIAGYVDTAGFLVLFGLLPAHLTADLVTIGAGLAVRGSLGTTSRLAMIPLFIASVIATAIVSWCFRRRGIATLTPLLALMTFALAAFCGVGVMLHRFVDGPDCWAVVVIGGTAVAAMGIQNAVMREALGRLCPTTVMTGNLTQFTIDVVELALSRFNGDKRNRRKERKEICARLKKFGMPLGGFLIGTIVGGWLTRDFGLLSIALPTFLSGGLAVISWKEARASSRPPKSERPRPSLFPRPELLSRPDI